MRLAILIQLGRSYPGIKWVVGKIKIQGLRHISYVAQISVFHNIETIAKLKYSFTTTNNKNVIDSARPSVVPEFVVARSAVNG